MKKLIPCIVLLALPFWLEAQKLYPVRDRIDSLSFRLAIIEGHMALEWEGNPAVFQPTREFPQIVAIQLEDGDLTVTYLEGRSPGRNSYQLSLSLQTANGVILTPPAYALRDHERSDDRPGQYRLIWMDFAEQWLRLGNSYKLFIRRSLMGVVNCSGERPEFPFKKQVPHFAAGGIGAALIGLGAVYRHQSNTAYANYQKFWTGGKPKAESAPFLEEAQKQDQNAQICTYAGLAILGVDLLWYGLRRWKIGRAQHNYDQYCNKSTSSIDLAPAILFTGPARSVPGPGLAVCYTF